MAVSFGTTDLELRDLLDDIADYLEQRSDVKDGNDGPRPNEAMILLTRLGRYID